MAMVVFDEVVEDTGWGCEAKRRWGRKGRAALTAGQPNGWENRPGDPPACPTTEVVRQPRRSNPLFANARFSIAVNAPTVCCAKQHDVLSSPQADLAAPAASCSVITR